jgi:hypothetical protein
MEDRELQPDSPEANELFAYLEREFAADAEADNLEAEAFKAIYGFEHDCRCADDVRIGQTEVVPLCYLEMAETMTSELKRLRGVLHVIARADSESPALLARLARESLR